MWEAELSGEANGDYVFYSSPDLQFSPGTLIENLTAGATGTVGGTNNSVLTLDGTGLGIVQMILTGTPRDFIRAQTAPPPPPLIAENFDAFAALPTGWASNGPVNGTNWEVGDPTGGYATGPANGASSPSNCAGTNIGTNGGQYTDSTDISLTTPGFAVPAGSGATLTFQRFIDTDLSDDVGSVRVLDADNSDTPIAGLEILNIEGDGTGASWSEETLALPALDVGGKNIKIEFRFVSGADATSYGGFYIDDVQVISE